MSYNTLLQHLKAVRNLQKMQCTLKNWDQTTFGDVASIRSDESVAQLMSVYKKEELQAANK